MALQPVAVGVNGEIGYIAVQQPNPEGTLVTAGTDMTIEPPNYMNNMFSQPIQSPSHGSGNMNRNSSIQGITQGGGPFGPNSIDGPPSQEALRLESERMKHELEVLQQKISCLNTARMNSSIGGNGGGTESVGSIGTSVESNHAENNGVVTRNETAQLTSELQLIENTIKDREREIIINRNTDMTHNANEGAANLEYGSYLAQGI